MEILNFQCLSVIMLATPNVRIICKRKEDAVNSKAIRSTEVLLGQNG